MNSTSNFYDTIILGAGGAGMMCAIHAARRGRRVRILDHAKKIGGKILISGGGRCNFTNLNAGPTHYHSQNPHFCKSALSRYRPDDFIQMVKNHEIPFHEKKLGQLFCDESAQNIVNLLVKECEDAGVEFLLECKIEKLYRKSDPPESNEEENFVIHTESGIFSCASLVVATGGLSIPKIGATGLGYQIAKQFGLAIIPTVPALDGFNFADTEVKNFRELAGVSLDTLISCNGVSFRENILFTHAGLSGPAALQASLYWNPGDPISLNLLPTTKAFPWFLEKKKQNSRAEMKNLLGELLPKRFTEKFCEMYFHSTLPLSQVPDKTLEEFAERLHDWQIIPSGTVGYGKAEVTRGGVDTNELSSKTMESKKVPGLYFIGEVVDVTGWLGGYNFHWAWASGWAAGQVV
jgi:predicted Rossmann fold flavoprotein